jgi:hypothetical protein
LVLLPVMVAQLKLTQFAAPHDRQHLSPLPHVSSCGSHVVPIVRMPFVHVCSTHEQPPGGLTQATVLHTGPGGITGSPLARQVPQQPSLG